VRNTVKKLKSLHSDFLPHFLVSFCFDFFSLFFHVFAHTFIFSCVTLSTQLNATSKAKMMDMSHLSVFLESCGVLNGPSMFANDVVLSSKSNHSTVKAKNDMEFLANAHGTFEAKRVSLERLDEVLAIDTFIGPPNSMSTEFLVSCLRRVHLAPVARLPFFSHKTHRYRVFFATHTYNLNIAHKLLLLYFLWLTNDTYPIDRYTEATIEFLGFATSSSQRVATRSVLRMKAFNTEDDIRSHFQVWDNIYTPTARHLVALHPCSISPQTLRDRDYAPVCALRVALFVYVVSDNALRRNPEYFTAFSRPSLARCLTNGIIRTVIELVGDFRDGEKREGWWNDMPNSTTRDNAKSIHRLATKVFDCLMKERSGDFSGATKLKLIEDDKFAVPANADSVIMYGTDLISPAMLLGECGGGIEYESAPFVVVQSLQEMGQIFIESGDYLRAASCKKMSAKPAHVVHIKSSRACALDFRRACVDSVAFLAPKSFGHAEVYDVAGGVMLACGTTDLWIACEIFNCVRATCQSGDFAGAVHPSTRLRSLFSLMSNDEARCHALMICIAALRDKADRGERHPHRKAVLQRREQGLEVVRKFFFGTGNTPMFTNLYFFHSRHSTAVSDLNAHARFFFNCFSIAFGLPAKPKESDSTSKRVRYNSTFDSADHHNLLRARPSLIQRLQKEVENIACTSKSKEDAVNVCRDRELFESIAELEVETPYPFIRIVSLFPGLAGRLALKQEDSWWDALFGACLQKEDAYSKELVANMCCESTPIPVYDSTPVLPGLSRRVVSVINSAPRIPNALCGGGQEDAFLGEEEKNCKHAHYHTSRPINEDPSRPCCQPASTPVLPKKGAAAPKARKSGPHNLALHSRIAFPPPAPEAVEVYGFETRAPVFARVGRDHPSLNGLVVCTDTPLRHKRHLPTDEKDEDDNEDVLWDDE
jgi:hypothetical protein